MRARSSEAAVRVKTQLRSAGVLEWWDNTHTHTQLSCPNIGPCRLPAGNEAESRVDRQWTQQRRQGQAAVASSAPCRWRWWQALKWSVTDGSRDPLKYRCPCQSPANGQPRKEITCTDCGTERCYWRIRSACAHWLWARLCWGFFSWSSTQRYVPMFTNRYVVVNYYLYYFVFVLKVVQSV